MQQSTSEDDCLVELRRLAKYGWPTSKRHVPEVVRHYWTMRDQIHETEGLLFLGDKLIIPATMRMEVLTMLHESHLGIDRTKARAREIVYWPGISKDIEDTVARCSKCVQYRRSNQKEPLMPHEVPEHPW